MLSCNSTDPKGKPMLETNASKLVLDIDYAQDAGKWEYIYVRKGNAKAIKCLDYLIWSLGQAEYTTKDQASKENHEDMITEVSRTLRILVDDLPQDKS